MRGHRDAGQQRGRNCKRPGIARADAEQLRLEEPHEQHCAGNARREADAKDGRATTDNQPEHMDRAGAPSAIRTPTSRVRCDTVKATTP